MISTTILFETLGGAVPDSMLKHLARHIPLPERSVFNRPDNPLPYVQCSISGRMRATFDAAILILNRGFTPLHFVT